MDLSRNWWVQKHHTFIPEKKERVSRVLLVSTEHLNCISDTVRYLHTCLLIRAKNIDYWQLNLPFLVTWVYTSSVHHVFPATFNSSEYELQAVINISDLERLQQLLSTYTFPLMISSEAEIISVDTTTGITYFHFVAKAKHTLTLPANMSLNLAVARSLLFPVCSSNMTGYQCRCEQNFKWSYNTCISDGACDAIIADTCGCINALPSDGQYCQPNTSRTGRPSTQYTV